MEKRAPALESATAADCEPQRRASASKRRRPGVHASVNDPPAAVDGRVDRSAAPDAPNANACELDADDDAGARGRSVSVAVVAAVVVVDGVAVAAGAGPATVTCCVTGASIALPGGTSASARTTAVASATPLQDAATISRSPTLPPRRVRSRTRHDVSFNWSTRASASNASPGCTVTTLALRRVALRTSSPLGQVADGAVHVRRSAPPSSAARADPRTASVPTRNPAAETTSEGASRRATTPPFFNTHAYTIPRVFRDFANEGICANVPTAQPATASRHGSLIPQTCFSFSRYAAKRLVRHPGQQTSVGQRTATLVGQPTSVGQRTATLVGQPTSVGQRTATLVGRVTAQDGSPLDQRSRLPRATGSGNGPARAPRHAATSVGQPTSVGQQTATSVGQRTTSVGQETATSVGQQTVTSVGQPTSVGQQTGCDVVSAIPPRGDPLPWTAVTSVGQRPRRRSGKRLRRRSGKRLRRRSGKRLRRRSGNRP